MKPLDDKDEILAPIRALPVEVELEQVAHMVAAFPLAGGTVGWLASLKTNLNTILMITFGTIFIGTAIHFMAIGTPAPQIPPETTILEIDVPEPVAEIPRTVSIQPAMIPASSLTDTVHASIPEAPVMMEPVPVPAPIAPAVVPAIVVTPPVVPPMTALPSATPQPYANEKTYDVRDFTAVASFCSANVFVEEGPWSVTASGDPDLLERLEFNVEKEGLKITMKKSDKRLKPNDRGTLKVEIRMPKLTRLDMSGSGSISVGEFGTAPSMAVNVLGSGDIDLKGVNVLGEFTLFVQGSGGINCRSAFVLGRTSVTVLGSGDVRSSGSTPIIEVLIQGSGDVDVSGMLAQSGKVTILGSGDASLSCSGPLERLVQGSGTVQNTGNAVDKEKKDADNDRD